VNEAEAIAVFGQIDMELVRPAEGAALTAALDRVLDLERRLVSADLEIHRLRGLLGVGPAQWKGPLGAPADTSGTLPTPAGEDACPSPAAAPNGSAPGGSRQRQEPGPNAPASPRPMEAGPVVVPCGGRAPLLFEQTDFASPDETLTDWRRSRRLAA
jgi:hypothetical protein